MRDADTPWLVNLCKRRYSDRYDSTAAEMWFTNVVLKGPMLFYPARTEHAFAITMLSVKPWLPAEINAEVVFLCADTGCMWEAIELARDSIEWARRRKCVHWSLPQAETGFDLTPIARRVGAKDRSPRYTLELT